MANEDFLVWKVLAITIYGAYETPYQYRRINFNKSGWCVMRPKSNETFLRLVGNRYIDGGAYHTFNYEEGAFKCCEEWPSYSSSGHKYFPAIVPKGAMYFRGKCGGDESIASSELVIFKDEASMEKWRRKHSNL